MFKVSLLPESYRKQLIGKKNKKIIISVAIIVLLCMLIIYSGLAVRLLILKNNSKDISKKNSQIMQRIDELRPYVDDYNALAVAEANFANIKPTDITALEMVNIVQSITPNYIEITALYEPEWHKEQVCVIEGELSAANNLSSADSMLESYKNIIAENEELKDSIRAIKIVNDGPLVTVDSETNAKHYSFRMIVSLKGNITVDEQTGTLITTNTTAPTTESTTATTAPTVTEDSTVEASTIA